MYIVNQDRNTVINLDNATVITLDGGKIFVRPQGESGQVVGAYSKERAEKVFSEMLNEIFPPSLIVTHNTDIVSENMRDAIKAAPMLISTRGDADVRMYSCGVYYMPEE